MGRIKKAQTGRPIKSTADSTAYYDKLSKKYFDEANSVRNAPYAVRAPKEQLKERWKKEKTLMGKGFEAQDNSLRQIRKGKPGYDKNGFPIKKQRSGGSTSAVKIKKAQVGKKIDPKVYLEESRKRVKSVVDSARKQEVKKGIKTYDDYLKSKIKKQRSGGKIKPKASNVSKKLGSAKKSIGNMRFTKKKK